MTTSPRLGSVLVALLAAWARADESTLRGTRQLAFEWIAGYEPRTLVTDHAAIDLDQLAMERWLALRRFQPAKVIYEQGAHSQPIARVALLNADPPKFPIPKHTNVYGRADNGDAVNGKLVEEAFWTSKEEEVILLVEYQARAEQENYSNCQVGGLTVSNAAKSDGCLAQNGTIQVLDLQEDAPVYNFDYSYDVSQDNFHGRTIQKFSANAYEEMWNCSTCPYDTYKKFVNYYEAYDYGDEWVQAAYDGQATSFKNGNIDFENQDKASRVEAVRVATKFMNIWMYIIRMMEHAIDECNEPCEKPDTKHTGPQEAGRCGMTDVRAWDQAVAFYAGSLEGESGGGNGVLMYDLADKMCAIFRTCGDDATMHDGTSFVNNVLADEFAEGQAFLMKRECKKAKASKHRIIKLMAVPLIQATLFTAYERNFYPPTKDADSAVGQAKSASYAATVLPLVHHCNPRDATTIYDNLRLKDGGADIVDFGAVKSAFEDTYECMGVTCEAVGGIWLHKKYVEGAAPCRDIDLAKSGGSVLTVAIIVLAVVGIIASALFVKRRSRSIQNQQRLEEQQRFEDREATDIPQILRTSRSFD